MALLLRSLLLLQVGALLLLNLLLLHLLLLSHDLVLRLAVGAALVGRAKSALTIRAARGGSVRWRGLAGGASLSLVLRLALY